LSSRFELAKKTPGRTGLTKILVVKQEDSFPLTILRDLSVANAARVVRELNEKMDRETGVLGEGDRE